MSFSFLFVSALTSTPNQPAHHSNIVVWLGKVTLDNLDFNKRVLPLACQIETTRDFQQITLFSSQQHSNPTSLVQHSIIQQPRYNDTTFITNLYLFKIDLENTIVTLLIRHF